MKTNMLKGIGIFIISVVGVAYILFLLAPIIINPIINKYIPQVENEINKASGLVSNLQGVKIVTTPKLTAGLKVDNFSLTSPYKEPIVNANDFQVKMSLVPLFAKKIEIDIVQLKNADIVLQFNRNGALYIEKYLPKTEPNTVVAPTPSVDNKNDSNTQTNVNNFPLKLSNHLPNIKIGEYKVTITDGVENYVLQGNGAEISDFILDKKIKLITSGKMVLKDKEQFVYNVNVLNKIMPQINLHDLVFAPPKTTVKPNEEKSVELVDIIGILEEIYKNKVTANVDINLKIEPNNINGHTYLTNLSMLNLPQSFVNLDFKGEKIGINSDLYTAEKEISHINGVIKTGKKTNLDMNLKSDVELANILKIVKEIALIFNIKDLQTLQANGHLSADFNIKSDLKNVQSNGYLKLPSANIFYGLYNIGIEDINTDIVLDNNNVNIKNVGFSIYNQPLKLFGTISEKAEADLHLVADKLSLKGLLVALGQASLLKENQVNSGTITALVDIKGKLDKINPVAKINIENINIKNIPMDILLKAPSTIVNITSDGQSFVGNATSTDIKAINPVATISVPQVVMNITPEMLEITPTQVSIEKINTTISGKIKNYLTEKINLDFITSNDIKSTLKGEMNLAKQSLNLNYATTSPSTIVIPMFDKSKMTFTGNIDIVGNMLNPILKGNVHIPTIDIPEVPVIMTNTNVKLNGTILHGTGSVEKFKSAGIEAENLLANIALEGENFYINNLKGTAFDGKIGGNIIYNISNAKTSIEFVGEGLNAEKAVYGAAGIKNALNGTLGFNTKLTLTVLDYEDMIRSMKGNLKFNIKNGSFLSIGRIDSFFQASNIINNTLLKTTVNTLSNATGLTETAKFDYIDGNLNFDNGWAILNPIKSSGKALAYYVTGKFNLINFSTNVIVLGRLDAPVVAKLGPLGELSADKLLSYIPKFGDMTAKFVDALTTNPKGENVAAIPALTNGSTNYKDFKVVFNGGLESSSSIKSFKWVSDVDTSAIEPQSVKETIETLKNSVGNDLTNTVENVKNTITTQKEEWNATKNQLKNSAEELKNLFKGF